MCHIFFKSYARAGRLSTKQGGDGVDFVAVLDQVIALLRQRSCSRAPQPADGQDMRLPTLHHGRREA
jgi:hypothetical protein